MLRKHRIIITDKKTNDVTLFTIDASSPYDAYQRFVTLNPQYKDYEEYGISASIDPSELYCETSASCDTISETGGNHKMSYFQVNWNDYTESLASIAMPEQWSSKSYPNNGILANYIVKTYDKLTSEKGIAISDDYAIFNTGLFTKYYEPIFAYQTKSEILFLTDYELSGIGVKERPNKANYFEQPEKLLFNYHYEIDIQYKHILDNDKNKVRLPKEFIELPNQTAIFNGAIDIMKKKVSANYRLAIPQYYNGKIQLLLPLCLLDNDKPDVAIAVTEVDGRYRGYTVLTLDMAYNNARLIAKPEDTWLKI